jgi:hypothetical protein
MCFGLPAPVRGLPKLLFFLSGDAIHESLPSYSSEDTPPLPVVHPRDNGPPCVHRFLTLFANFRPFCALRANHAKIIGVPSWQVGPMTVGPPCSRARRLILFLEMGTAGHE